MAQLLVLDVASQARAVLGTSRIFDLRCLQVQCDGAGVVLRGSVSSFYHKQLAQEMLKTAIDGIEVVNEIDVDYSLERPENDEAWRYS